jgi:hypothetical protein
VVQCRANHGPQEGHQERRGDALAGDVGDDDAERAEAVGQGKDVEEVTADGPRGAVVACELPPLGLDPGEQDERALDALGNPELALQEVTLRERGVADRRSASLDGGDRVVA